MVNIIPLLVFALFTIGSTDPGVFIEAENDTVIKIKYSGTSPNNLTHPALAIEGKAMSFIAKSNNVQNAKAIIGRVELPPV